MKSVYDTVIPPSKNFVFVDEIALLVLAAKKETDDGNIMFCSFLDLLEEVDFLLNKSSKRGEAGSGSDEDNFLPFHCISKGRFSKFCSKLFGVSQKVF